MLLATLVETTKMMSGTKKKNQPNNLCLDTTAVTADLTMNLDETLDSERTIQLLICKMVKRQKSEARRRGRG